VRDIGVLSIAAPGAEWDGGGNAGGYSAFDGGDCTVRADRGGTGLLTQEVAEPATTPLRLETDYVYDAFGNKTSATVNGVDITTSTTSYAHYPIQPRP
jgi:YD repeat-containing protein